jgi:hypothetical protein
MDKEDHGEEGTPSPPERGERACALLLIPFNQIHSRFRPAELAKCRDLTPFKSLARVRQQRSPRLAEINQCRSSKTQEQLHLKKEQRQHRGANLSLGLQPALQSRRAMCTRIEPSLGNIG